MIAPARATGLQVRTRSVPGMPVVALRAWVPGGARAEGIPGQARVTGRLLAEGTQRRDFRSIADDAEGLGANVHSSGGFEHHHVTLDVMADDWERACNWLAELVLEPVFPEDRTRWVTRQLKAELDSLGDRPEIRTAWGFLDQLYAPHPRCRPVQGTPEGLAALTPEDCATFHLESLKRGLIVTAAGRLDEEAVERHLRELFRDLETGRGETVEPPAPEDTAETHRRVILPDSDQAHLFAGHRTLPRAHDDYEALELAGIVLGAGAGLTGRIPDRIREKEGLAYTARGQTVAGCGLDPGRLVIYVGTSEATLEQAERGCREELERLVTEGVEEDELESARSYLLGREPFQRETARQWADLLAESAFYGLPLDRPGWREERLRAVTHEELEAAIRRHLHPDQLRVTVGVTGEETKRSASRPRLADLARFDG